MITQRENVSDRYYIKAPDSIVLDVTVHTL